MSPITHNGDLFGKTAADLQTGVAVSGNAITGTLKYISDYPGFSSKVSEQYGNYLALHCEVPGVSDATIKVTVTKTSTLDSDGDIVLRIADKDSQTVTVVASKAGLESVTKVFSLSGLTVESA